MEKLFWIFTSWTRAKRRELAQKLITIKTLCLETGINLNATVFGRTPPELPQLWLIGMARKRLHPVVPS